MRRLLIRVGLVAFLIAGCDRLASNAGDLSVGDCFDEPASTETVDDVQRQPCTEPHGAEVIFVGDHPDQDSYPTTAVFDDFVANTCIPVFESYTGRDWETDTELDMAYFYPTSEGWPEGDHEVSCYIVRIDSAKMTSSMKASE